jgi:hypothetical protein
MVLLRLTAFLTLLLFIMGFSHPAWSQKRQPHPEEELSFSKKNPQDEESSKEEDLFLGPLKSRGEETFLVLDPDGISPSDYQRFLSPLDQPEKGSKP